MQKLRSISSLICQIVLCVCVSMCVCVSVCVCLSFNACVYICQCAICVSMYIDLTLGIFIIIWLDIITVVYFLAELQKSTYTFGLQQHLGAWRTSKKSFNNISGLFSLFALNM